MDRKTFVSIVVLAALIGVVTLWELFRASSVPLRVPWGTSQGLGTAGDRCGGFIHDEPTCAAGFHCELDVAKADTGGVCVPDFAEPDSYKDASYEIDGQNIKLTNGVAQMPAAPGSASMMTIRYFGNDATGDLNGDGVPDAAFILTADAGGSGTFYYVAAALKTDKGYMGTNTVILGDRIAPQTTEIKNGVLTVNYADRKKDEPMSAPPSVGISRHYRVEGGTLNRAANSAP